MGNHPSNTPKSKHPSGFSFTIHSFRDIPPFLSLFNSHNLSATQLPRLASDFFQYRHLLSATDSQPPLSYINLTARFINNTQIRTFLFTYLTQCNPNLGSVTDTPTICKDLLKKRDFSNFTFLLTHGIISLQEKNNFLLWAVQFQAYDTNFLELCRKYAIPFDFKYQQALSCEEDPTSSSIYTGNLLHLASEPECIPSAQEFFKLLIEICPENLITRDSSGRTPLLASVRDGHLNKFQLLLNNGANILDKDIRNNCIMHYLLDRWLPPRRQLLTWRERLYQPKYSDIWMYLTKLPRAKAYFVELFRCRNDEGKTALVHLGDMERVNFEDLSLPFNSSMADFCIEFIGMTKEYYSVELCLRLIKGIPRRNQKFQGTKRELCKVLEKFMVTIWVVVGKRYKSYEGCVSVLEFLFSKG